MDGPVPSDASVECEARFPGTVRVGQGEGVMCGEGSFRLSGWVRMYRGPGEKSSSACDTMSPFDVDGRTTDLNPCPRTWVASRTGRTWTPPTVARDVRGYLSTSLTPPKDSRRPIKEIRTLEVWWFDPELIPVPARSCESRDCRWGPSEADGRLEEWESIGTLRSPRADVRNTSRPVPSAGGPAYKCTLSLDPEFSLSLGRSGVVRGRV